MQYSVEYIPEVTNIRDEWTWFPNILNIMLLMGLENDLTSHMWHQEYDCEPVYGDKMHCEQHFMSIVFMYVNMP